MYRKKYSFEIGTSTSSQGRYQNFGILIGLGTDQSIEKNLMLNPKAKICFKQLSAFTGGAILGVATAVGYHNFRDPLLCFWKLYNDRVHYFAQSFHLTLL
jgi:hypothetical protein